MSAAPLHTSPRDMNASAEQPRSESIALAFVLGVWIVMTIAAAVFVARYSTAVPFQDDLELAQQLIPGQPFDWGFLWSQANEHRIVISRAVFLALLAVTHDFRAASWFQVALLSALALLLMSCARRLRGRASVADAFFPLLLLHRADATNLLLGLQIGTAVPTALVCGFVVLALRRAGS